MSKVLSAWTIAVLVVVTACGGSDAAVTIESADSSLGQILADGDGNTVYLFVPDAQGDSTCYDQCEANWPPVPGDVAAGGDADSGLLGETTRTDGTSQATYNGWPLYYFGGDAEAGQTNGQGLNDVWYVVSPAGDAVR